MQRKIIDPPADADNTEDAVKTSALDILVNAAWTVRIPRHLSSATTTARNTEP